MTDRTIRDDFAIAALTGLLVNDTSLSLIAKISEKKGARLAAYAAELAYEFADAMIEARKPDPLGRDADGVTARFREYLQGRRKAR